MAADGRDTPESETGRERIARLVREQGEACAELGSPLYAVLLDRLADDLLAGGPAAGVLGGHEHDPGPSALALRLLGAVHRLVLEGRAPELAAFYPSAGGVADADGAWPVLLRVLTEQRESLRALLHQPPQTNEVGRAAALIGGLLHVVAWRPGPLRLFEIGASAGLNLRADRFRVELPDGRSVGPADSPVVLRDPWRGEIPPVEARLLVVDRAGCDTEPVDPTSPEGRLRLTSYVWPDQLDRLARLHGALDLAGSVPAVVERAPAEDFVRRLELAPGTTTVVWHSVMWQYLTPPERAGVSARLDELGRRAREGMHLAHLQLEPQRRNRWTSHEFLVKVRTWPGGEERILGNAHPHGIPTTWE